VKQKDSQQETEQEVYCAVCNAELYVFAKGKSPPRNN